MRLITLNLCLLFFSFTAFSQKNFTAAIIVKNNGDTVAGKIDYRNWKKNPDNINFIDNSSRAEVLDPSSISSFYIINENERYVSYDVSIDKGTDQDSKAFSSRMTADTFLVKKVFLLQLIKDPSLSLFQYNDGVRNNFYYVQQEGNPVGLIYHFLFVDGEQVRTIDSYKQQLEILFSSCPNVAKKTGHTGYTVEALKRITGEYLACSNPSHISEIKKKDPAPIKFGVVGGVMYNTFKFVGTRPRSPVNNSTIALDNFSGNLSPVIGVSLDIGFGRNENKLHLVNELIYKQYSTSDTGFTHTVLYDITNKVSYSFAYLQLNTIGRYFFETRNMVNPFINIGLGNAVMITEKKNENHVTSTSGSESETVAIKGVRKYELTPLFGAGIRVKKIVAEARFAFGKGFSPYTAFESRVKSYQLVATYYFK